MPNEDLGTASGTIRLNLDDRASGRLVATLIKMSRQFDDINKKLDKIDRTLNSADKSFDKASRSIDRSTKSTKGFSSSIFEANRNITRFVADVNRLYVSISQVSNVMERANRWYIPLNRTYRILDQMQQLRFDGMTGSFLRFGTAIQRVGILNNVLSRTWKQGFLGIDRSMREMPMWVQNLNRLAIKIAQVGTAGLLIGRLARMNVFEKFLNTRAFEKIANASEAAGFAIQRFARKADYNLNYFSRAFNRGFAPIAGFANGAKGFLAGAALVTSGIDGIVNKFAWLGRIPKPILTSLGILISTVLPAALEVFGKALTFTSNLLVGLLDGVKQLSGGLLVLPGILASIGAVASSLIPVFAGLKDKFKDIFSDDYTKAWEAYWKLPEHLRPMAKVLKELKPLWKDFTKSLQTEAFAKAEVQIQKIAEHYLPIWEKGAKQVIIATRGMKDEFVAFLGTQQTMTDVGVIYSRTANTINNLKNAVQPALAGLRDIATVGVGFIRDMSATLPGLVQGFADWAKTNRENGNLLGWMQDSRKGVYDLVTGLVDLSKALWTVLTVFKSNTGEGFLSSFADAMERFNSAVQRSAGSGMLRDIGNAVRDLGTDKMQQFIEIAKQFIDMMEGVWPVIKTVANTFASIFVPALKQAMVEVEFFTKILHDLGIDAVIGTILGLVYAFKLLPTVLVPLYHGFKVLAGSFMLLRNAGKMTEIVNRSIDGLVAGFDKFGGVGSKASASITRVRTGLSGLISTIAGIAGPLAAITLAVGVAWLAWDSRNEKIKAGLEAVRNRTKLAKEEAIELQKAFISDRGLAGSTVMDAVSGQIDSLFTQLDEVSQTGPGVLEHLGDMFSRGGLAGGIIGPIATLVSGESDALNELQKISTDAERVQGAFKRAGATQDELKKAVSGSADEYQKLRHRLLEAGDGGAEAVGEIDRLRASFQAADRAAKELGPSGALVAEGIRKIAEAGGDATTKLEGLRAVLEGLGLLKTTALEAAAAYEKGIDDLASAVQEALTSGASLNDLIDEQSGTFNVTTESGRKLFDVFKSLGDEFLANAAKNGNAADAYKKFEEQLDSLVASTGLTREQLIKLAGDVGVLPTQVGIALQLDGADTVTQDLGKVLLQAQASANSGVFVPVAVSDPQSVADEINRIMEPLTASVGEQGNILLKPGISPESLTKLETELSKRGISVNGQAPSTPATMPIKPVGTLGSTGKPDETVSAPGQEQLEVREGLDGILNEIAGFNGETADKGRDGGSNFVDSYAAGIKDNDAAKDAARKMAEDILKQFHQSPPKEGPMRRRGDAARYGGEQFTTAYATGITSEADQATGAAQGIASSAVGGLQNDKMYQTGEFLGQLTQLVDFASNFVDVFDKLAQTVLGFAKFVSDPMGKGTFFGKSMGFKRDPSISDAQLAKNQADAAQQRVFGMYGSGQRPDLDPATGRVRTSAPGDLGANASKQDTANYIIDKAMSLGYSREQANKFLIQGVGESGLAADASNPAGWEGIYQFDASTWELAGGGDVRNAQKNIDNYFNLAAIRGLTPESFLTGEQLGQQVSIGGPWHPENQALGHLTQAQATAQQYISGYQPGAGQTTTGILPGIPASIANLSGSKLRPGEGVEAGLEPAAASVAALLSNMFPGITDIGGRQDRTGPQMHPQGRALDVMTGEDAALGDKIAAFLEANFKALGVQSYIWRDIGKNLVANEGGGPGTTYTAQGHGGPSGTESGSHVHVQFADGGKLDVAADGTMNFNVPANSPYAGANYGLPPTPQDLAKPGDAPKDLFTLGPNGEKIPATDHLGNNPVDVNPATGRPWTPEEAIEFWNRPENAERYDAAQLQPGDQNIPGIFQGSQDDLLSEIKESNKYLGGILDGTNAQLTEQEAITAATQFQTEIDKQIAIDTPESRARASALQGEQSKITSQYGLTQEQNPVDQAMGVVSSVSSIAGQMFQVLNSGIEAIGATKDITQTLVRYPSNTEDIFRMIDDFQKYIKFAADIAGATSSVLSAVGSMTGGMDFGGTAAAGQVAGLIQGALETWNAMIDLGQEAYRIIGTYVGDFLGFLVGGQDSVRGQIKFLLDTQTNQLMTWTQDNPLDKQAHAYGQTNDSRAQMMRDVYVFGGPGQDPRDNTRQMLLQVRMNQLAVPTGQ